MEQDDARDLLRGAGLELPDAKLVERAGGWPAGLYLAEAMSIYRNPDVTCRSAAVERAQAGACCARAWP